MGDAAIGEAILDAAAQVKAANPAALWCCDPVMGDVGRGIYVRPGIPEFLRDRAMPMADIATPNRYELEWLTGLPVTSLETAKRAVAALQAIGPRRVLLTSLEVGEGEIGMLAADGDAAWLVTTPMLPISVNGAGDATAALFLFHWLRCGRADEALCATASAIFGILRRTVELGARELQIVAAQAELVQPSRSFAARAL